MEWNRWYDTGGYDKAWAGQQTSDGGYILAGEADNNANALVIKTDDSGDTLWVRKFGLAGSNETAYGICERPDTTYVLAGFSTSVDPSSDMYVVGITASGDSSWSLCIGGSEAEEALGVFPIDDRGYIVTGWTNSFGSGGQDVYLVSLGYPPSVAANPPVSQPAQFLLDVFPTPFNSIATLDIDIPFSGQVEVAVYSLLGRHIATLHDGILESGEHRFAFDASSLPSGIYFARIQAGDFVKTQKLLLLK